MISVVIPFFQIYSDLEEAEAGAAAGAAAEGTTEEEAGAIRVDDHGEPLRPTLVDEDEPSTGVAVTPVEEGEGPSLEEIVARAEAQQALFGEAYEKDGAQGGSPTAVDDEPEGSKS